MVDEQGTLDLSRLVVPLRNRIMVTVEKQDALSKGGLIIPDTARREMNCGWVVAVGDGHVAHNGIVVPLTVYVGDFVYFSEYAGVTFKVKGKEYKIIQEADVLWKSRTREPIEEN